MSRFAGSANQDADENFVDACDVLAHRLPDALEMERLHLAMDQLAEAEKLQRALYQIADLASGERDMDEVLHRIHAIVAELTYAENFFIALYDGDSQLITLPYFRDCRDEAPHEGTVYSVEEWRGSLTWWVIQHGKTLMGPSEALLLDHELPADGYGPHCEDWLGVPLLRQGLAFGALVVQSYDPSRHYADKDRALLTFVSQHVATALDRLRAHERLELHVRARTEELRAANDALRLQVSERERAERLQAALFKIAELGSTSASLTSFYQSLHGVISGLVAARNFYIALLSDDGEHLHFPYSVDEREPVRPSRTLKRGLTEYVLRTAKPLLADRPAIARLQACGELHSIGVLSVTWLGVPLIYDDRAVGVMATQSYDDSHHFDQRDQDILIFVSYHIANALQRKQQADSLREANIHLERRVSERTDALAKINNTLRDQIAERELAERRLRHAVLHDGLTGLPNRTLLLDRMSQALDAYRRDAGAEFAVLFLDLDRFKVINDSLGHLVGDELLKLAGTRIRAQLEGGDMIARLGGDEFAVLLDAGMTRAHATEVASGVIAAMDEPMRIAGKDIFSSVSIGIAFVQPHYRTAEELLRDADAALYRAKASGRHRFEVFDEDLRRQVLLQVETEEQLRRGLARREFEPVFQPIFALGSGKVVGYEALMRWRHPQYGVVEPARFLSQAEESGLMEALDWQVYEAAFALAEPLLGRHAYLGINVGARHLRTPLFVDTLLRRLDTAGFNPAQLRIEITESALLEDPRQSRVVMDEMRRYGISIALDDFGTGYSSLSYLHQFPLQAIKIDRSFIDPLDNPLRANAPTLLRAIHALGHELGLEVIAEGIETASQLEQVKRLGEVSGQGFLLARPASVHAIISAGQAAS
ncbi:MAG TPA: EAL domain-containing protein [Chiayiivirga sp.]|nr:EAL domain-containing protein [Chiayiivirga sp.]